MARILGVKQDFIPMLYQDIPAVGSPLGPLGWVANAYAWLMPRI